MEIKKGKKIYLEVLRIICIVLVIFNHTSPDGYMAFIGETNGFLYGLKMFMSILCRIAVPVFFMISGALLLGRQESLKVLFTKRILRIVLVLVLVSVPYYIWRTPDAAPSVVGFFLMLITGAATTSMWYLYAYIGFLLMLPFLRAAAARLKEKEYIYLLIAHIIFTVFFAVLDHFIFKEGHNTDFSITIIIETNVFYPLMGYYIENVMDSSRFRQKNYWSAGILSLIAVFVTIGISILYYQIQREALDIDAYQTFFEVLLCVPAISLFFILKGVIRVKEGSAWYRILSCIGGAVFGVYLIDPLLRGLLSSHVHRLLDPIVGSFVSALALVMIVMILGTSVICLLKSIPYLKKIVNYFI